MLVVLHGVVALSSKDEVSRDQFGSLVEQLVERMLGICSRLAKEDRTSSVLDVVTIAGNSLAVGLHRELLEIGREPVQVLVESNSG